MDCTLSGVADDSRSEFVAFPVQSSWTGSGIQNEEIPDIAGDPASSWSIDVLDYDRNSGGFLRLDLRDLVRGWASGEVENYGIVVETPDVSGQSLTNDLGSAHLVIRYTLERASAQ